MVCPNCQIGDIEYCFGGIHPLLGTRNPNCYVCDYCDVVYTEQQYSELIIEEYKRSKE